MRRCRCTRACDGVLFFVHLERHRPQAPCDTPTVLVQAEGIRQVQTPRENNSRSVTNLRELWQSVDTRLLVPRDLTAQTIRICAESKPDPGAELGVAWGQAFVLVSLETVEGYAPVAGCVDDGGREPRTAGPDNACARVRNPSVHFWGARE
jgi:hypothetical protein